MQNQSFPLHFVASVPAPLATGNYPVALVPGQIGIIDGATNQSTLTPQVPNTASIYLGYRLPAQLEGALMATHGNSPYYSQPIHASKIKAWRGSRGSLGQVEVVTVGYDTVDATKSLAGSKVNETKRLYVRLSGSPITKVHSAQGMLLVYEQHTGCQVCCPGDVNCDPCAPAVQKAIAEGIVEKINKDVSSHYGWISASVTKKCTTSAIYDTTAYNAYDLTITDSGDEYALALVQASYPAYAVERISRTNLTSTYRLWKTGSAPTDFSTGNVPFISGCANCPTGYTTVTAKAYIAEIEDAGDATALTAAIDLFNATKPWESVVRVSFIGGVSKYVVISEYEFNLSNASSTNEVQTLTANSATGGTFTLTFGDETTAAIAYNATAATIKTELEALGNVDVNDIAVTGGAANANPVIFTYSGTQYAAQNIPLIVVNNTLLTGGSGGALTVTTESNLDSSTSTVKSVVLASTGSQICILNTASTVAWVDNGDGISYKKDYTITLGDTVCGEDRLAELVAAYSAIGAVTIVTNATCATTYRLRVNSNVVQSTCQPDAVIFPMPSPYDGNIWKAGDIVVSSGADTDCVYGVMIKAAAISRETSECTYGTFTPDFDGIHIEVSEFNPDPNASPEICTTTWPITYLQRFKSSQLTGSQIMKFEEETYANVLRYYSDDAGVREAYGIKLGAKPGVVYDHYQLEFEYSYSVGGFSQNYTDTYNWNIYFEAGKGKAFEAAMNAFVCGANPFILPVNL